jgi:hypothetical protein
MRTYLVVTGWVKGTDDFTLKCQNIWVIWD